LYNDPNLSPYNGHFDILGNDFFNGYVPFAPKLIKEIQNTQSKKLAHTFSHYYCLEKDKP
jgi:hypothetical protein